MATVYNVDGIIHEATGERTINVGGVVFEETEAAAGGITINPGVGAIGLTGQNVDVISATGIEPGAGAVSIVGQDVDVTFPTAILPGSGSVVIAGQNVNVAFGRDLEPTVGSISIAGQNVSVSVGTGTFITPGIGSVGIAGQNVDIGRGTGMQPGQGAIAISGQGVNVAQQRNINPVVGAIAITGQSVSVGRGTGVQPATGSITLAGQNVTVSFSQVPDMIPDQTISNQPLSILVNFTQVIVTGFTGSIATSIDFGEYSINSGPYVSIPSTVTDGDTIDIRHQTSASFSSFEVSNFTYGGLTSSFTSRTINDPAIVGGFDQILREPLSEPLIDPVEEPAR